MSVGRNQTGIFYTSLKKEETDFPFSVPQNELDQNTTLDNSTQF